MNRSNIVARLLRVSYTPALVARQQPLLQQARPQLLYQPLRSTRFASHSSDEPPVRTAQPYQRQEKTVADEKIEEITELFYTAQDEFEIAMEETEKVSVYAEEDRKAAREELDKVQEAYRAVVEGVDKDLAEEVKRRIGQRIRELEQGVKAMEELAMNQD